MEAVATIEIDTQEIDAKGRPCKYETHVKPYLDDILEWLGEGNTEQSICRKLGIHPYTWIRYKQSINELSEVITRANRSAGELMLHKQYQKASGMTVSVKRQKATKDGEILDLKEELYIPPDTNAAEFWARHKYPDYKPPKADTVNLIQNNFQLPQLQAEISKLEQELKSLETIETVGTRVIEE